MADTEEIERVQEMLGGAELAEQYEYDAAKIESLLDSGYTENAIAAQFWESRHAATAEFIDISESGSSRGMSAITRNAKDLAAMYRGRANAENPPEIIRRRGLRAHKLGRA